MTIEEIRKILDIGENTEIEFKQSRDKLVRSVYESICAFVFSQMGIVEELGSGTKKIFKYTPLLSNGRDPQIEEQDVYRITIPYEPIEASTSPGTEKSKEKSKEKIFRLIKSDPYITTEQLMAETSLSESAVYKIVRALREAGVIHRIGGDNGGYWKFSDQ